MFGGVIRGSVENLADEGLDHPLFDWTSVVAESQEMPDGTYKAKMNHVITFKGGAGASATMMTWGLSSPVISAELTDLVVQRGSEHQVSNDAS